MSSDPDKQAVYYAESVTFDGTLFTEPLHTNEITELAYRLFSHSWWTVNSIPVPIIKPTTGNDTSSYARIYHPYSIYGDDRDSTIHISPHDINAHTLAHEAAHVAQYHLFPLAMNPHIRSHGPEFRAVYLTVANILLGFDVVDTLADNFTRFLSDDSLQNQSLDLDTDTIGIYPEWRLAKTIADLVKVLPPGDNNLRMSGAIAL